MRRTVAELLGDDPPADQPASLPFIVDGNTLAAVLGCTTRTVNKLAADGTIPRAGRGRFDIRAAVQAYVVFKTAPAAASDKARREKADADLAELKAAKAAASLLDATDVEREWATILRDVRAALLALPARMHARLPHLAKSDVAEFDSELREALRTLGGADD